MLYENGILGYFSSVSRHIHGCWGRYKEAHTGRECDFVQVLGDLGCYGEDYQTGEELCQVLHAYIGLLVENDEIAKYGGDVVHGYFQHIKDAIEAIIPLACYVAPEGHIDTDDAYFVAKNKLEQVMGILGKEARGDGALSAATQGIASEIQSDATLRVFTKES